MTGNDCAWRMKRYNNNLKYHTLAYFKYNKINENNNLLYNSEIEY